MSSRAELKTKATMNTTEFDRGIAKMKQGVTAFTTGQLSSMAKSFVGAFATYKIAEFARSTMQAGKEALEASRNLKMSTEELQALSVTAQESGSSVEGMHTALARLQKAMNSAASGNKKMIDALRTLGLSGDFVAKHQGDMGAVFEAVSKKISSSGDSMQVNNAAGAVLGKGYVDLNETMKKVAKEGLSAIKQGLLETGEIMTGQTVYAARQLEEAFDRLERRWRTRGRTGLVGIMGGLGTVLDPDTGRDPTSKKLAMGLGAGGGLVGGGALALTLGTGGWGALLIPVLAALAGGAGAGAINTDWNKASESLFGRPEDMPGAAKAKTKADLLAEQANKKAIQDALDEIALGDKKKAILNAPMKDITVGAPVAADQFARMGLFSGGQVNNGPRILMERQIKVQEEMEKRLAKIEALDAKSAGTMEEIRDNLEE